MGRLLEIWEKDSKQVQKGNSERKKIVVIIYIINVGH